MTVTCPKCASCEARSIEAIYCECASQGATVAPGLIRFFRQAAPPDRRHPLFWMALTALFTVLVVSGLPSLNGSSGALAACGLLSAWMAREAVRYNRVDLPKLAEYWRRSFICTRCGEVYVPA